MSSNGRFLLGQALWCLFISGLAALLMAVAGAPMAIILAAAAAALVFMLLVNAVCWLVIGLP